jgi:hypothetical protein
MKLLEIGSVQLRLPEGWTVFCYEGVIYRLDKFGNWVIERRRKSSKN